MQEKELIEKTTLINAIKYNGKANVKSVLGAVIQINPREFKSKIPEIRALVEKYVERINSMTLEQQKSKLLKIDPEGLKEEEKRKKEIIIELPDLNRFKDVILRLAPYPSGPLHIGNSRMVVLNDYCAKKYKGKLLLVFDDTIGSETKLIDPEAYDSIPEGLEYLDVKIHGKYYKSDRLDIFYKHTIDIIHKNKFYICTCNAKEWRNKYKEQKIVCPCRKRTIEENLEHWERMLDGTYPEKAAVVRLKSGMDLPDPAIRDPVMLRISEKEHPRVGTKYRVWPLLEFSWGIDDHEFQISHIIRGKDLKKEGIIEEFIWDIYEWKKPSIILYGRMKLKDIKLSKSKTAELIRDKIYTNWTDPRTWSLQSLKRRGIQPEALRKSLLNFGLNIVDVTFSPDQVYSINRQLIDSKVNRYFMVKDPLNLLVKGLNESIRKSHPLKHPEFPERGTRTILLKQKNGSSNVQVPREDIKSIGRETLYRLKDLMNITIETIKDDRGIAIFHSLDLETARGSKAKMIQWVPTDSAIDIQILMPDGKRINAKAEPDLLKTKQGEIIQFERVGFCRVEEITDKISIIWTHR